MFRIAYVLESGSFVGKAAAVLMLFLIIGVPLFFIIYIAIENLIEKIKRHKRNDKKKGIKYYEHEFPHPLLRSVLR